MEPDATSTARSSLKRLCRLDVSWARVEPRRGAYDEGELAALAGRLRAAPGPDPVVVCLHSGALPDWMIARHGWLDADSVAAFGCFVDRVAQPLGIHTAFWATLAGFFEEAEAYGAEARSVARTLLDAHAAAYLHLRRTQGRGGRPPAVGILERIPPLRRFLPRPSDGLIETLRTGKIHPPFGMFGELPNGTPALDFLGVLGEERPNATDLPFYAIAPLPA